MGGGRGCTGRYAGFVTGSARPKNFCIRVAKSFNDDVYVRRSCGIGLYISDRPALDKRKFRSFFITTKTGRQSILIRSFISFQKPETWEQLKKKYDPTGEYTVKYQDVVQKQGLNV